MFDEVSHRDVVSWSSMIASYVNWYVLSLISYRSNANSFVLFPSYLSQQLGVRNLSSKHLTSFAMSRSGVVHGRKPNYGVYFV